MRNGLISLAAASGCVVVGRIGALVPAVPRTSLPPVAPVQLGSVPGPSEAGGSEPSPGRLSAVRPPSVVCALFLLEQLSTLSAVPSSHWLLLLGLSHSPLPPSLRSASLASDFQLTQALVAISRTLTAPARFPPQTAASPPPRRPHAHTPPTLTDRCPQMASWPAALS